MRLLIFPEYAFPANHAVVNTVFETLLPALGHVVHMVRPLPGTVQVEERPAPWGGRLIGFPVVLSGSAAANARRWFRRRSFVRSAVARLADEPLDAILVRNDLLQAAEARRLARARGIPFVFQVSSPEAEFRMAAARAQRGLAARYSALRGRIDLLRRTQVCRAASGVLAISDGMRRYFVNTLGLDASRVFSFPMGATVRPDPTPDSIDAIRRRLAIGNRPVIAYVGVLHEVRRPEFMLDVLGAIRESGTDAALLVVTYQPEGDPRRVAFRAAADARGLPVRIVGPVPNPEVEQYVRVAQVLISPYAPAFENRICSPTKTIEGLAAGVPVVGSAEVEEHTHAIAASGGLIAVPWSVPEFAAAVDGLLRDDLRRTRMGLAGRDWVQQTRSYAHLTRYLERLLMALAEGAPPATLPHAP